MFRLVCFALLASSTLALAQSPKFTFTSGQVLNYRVEQITTVTETTLEEMTNKPVTGLTVTKLDLSRKWTVKSVEAGVATLEMSITAMKQQINRPGPADKTGKPTVDQVLLDSASPEGQQQMAAFLNKPIVTIKLDEKGKLIEAKTTAGNADRLQAELPFRVVLPEAFPMVGGTWDRSFKIKLPPPLGTGEEYEATQTYSLKGDTSGYTVIGLTTTLKNPPKDNSEWPPLVPMLWEGDLFFHPATGRYSGAKLSIKKEIANHQGEGSKFAYESSYTEVLSEK